MTYVLVHAAFTESAEAGRTYINRRNKQGNTALHLAASAGNDRTARLLLKRHAALNFRNSDGLLPLQVAQEALARFDADLTNSGQLGDSADAAATSQGPSMSARTRLREEFVATIKVLRDESGLHGHGEIETRCMAEGARGVEYDLRRDATQYSSPPSLTGSFRSRCVVSSRPELCLGSSEDDPDSLQVELIPCPDTNKEYCDRDGGCSAPRWAHSGSNPRAVHANASSSFKALCST